METYDPGKLPEEATAAQSAQGDQAGGGLMGGVVSVGDTPVDAPSDEDLPQASWESKIEAEKSQQLAKAELASQSKLEQRIVNWDMRKLVAERLRAETGADLAHGAAVGEDIRMHKHIVEQNIARIGKIEAALSHVPTGIDEKVGAADADAGKASDAAKATGILLKGAKGAVGPTLATTRRETMELIKQSTATLAREEADAFAERMDWDKPPFWKKILAMRASEPYAEAMVVAAQRFTQYQAEAKRMLNDARAVQARAAELPKQVESFKQQGDIPGAVDARHRMRELLDQSAKLGNQARRLWKTSDDAWKSMSEWQAASFAAATFVAQTYDAHHTLTEA